MLFIFQLTSLRARGISGVVACSSFLSAFLTRFPLLWGWRFERRGSGGDPLPSGVLFFLLFAGATFILSCFLSAGCCFPATGCEAAPDTVLLAASCLLVPLFVVNLFLLVQLTCYECVAAGFDFLVSSFGNA